MKRPPSIHLAVVAVGALAIAAALSACGGSGRATAPVRLTLSAPAAGLRTTRAHVTVAGSVSPTSAAVLVLGRPVAVHDGTFKTEVPVPPGTTIIDVLAGAPHAPAAMGTVTVTRIALVAVPHLNGESAAAAAAALRHVGLASRAQQSSDPFDFLFPIPTQVCSTNPRAGKRVLPGTVVTLKLGKFC